MRPIIHSSKFDLVEPIGLGTGLVESSLSLWKRAAERTSVGLGDFVRWAFTQSTEPIEYSYEVTGQGALRRQFHGIDGLGALAKVYIRPLRSLVASDRIEACTLIPFAGLLSEFNLLRIERAWCPLCLGSMLSGTGPYEPLLWRLQAVKVCPVHEFDLSTVCHMCKAPRQEVIGRFTRVGCCNRCGQWMGTREANGGLRHANEFEVGVSRAIESLLALTAEFEGHTHDGKSTLSQLLMVSGVPDLLISKCGSSHKTGMRRLPRLSVLATIGAASRQPLHRIMLGHLLPWTESSTPSSDKNARKERSPRNWKDIEANFERIVNGPRLIKFRDACKDLNISTSSARNHFPNLVVRISERKRIARSESALEREKARSVQFRQAVRSLIEAGKYPSWNKLAAILEVDIRNLWCFKDVRDEEWIRAGGRANFRG